MSDSTYKCQAEAWNVVWAALEKGNPTFSHHPGTGRDCAVLEIERLYDVEKQMHAWKAAHSRVLEERNCMLDQRDAARSNHTASLRDLDAARRERDEESHRKNAALHELEAAHRQVGERSGLLRYEVEAWKASKDAVMRKLDKERQKHTEALMLLEQERETGDQLAREVVKSRDELARAQSPLPPVMGGGVEAHMLNIRQYVTRFEGIGPWRQRQRQLGEALYYLLDRDQLQTAAVKCLSKRLDALEPNAKSTGEASAAGWPGAKY